MTKPSTGDFLSATERNSEEVRNTTDAEILDLIHRLDQRGRKAIETVLTTMATSNVAVFPTWEIREENAQ